MTGNPETEAELIAAGWRLAATTAGADMARMLEMYRELGIEVRAIEVDPTACEGCTVCFEEGAGSLYRVFTRPRAP